MVAAMKKLKSGMDGVIGTSEIDKCIYALYGFLMNVGIGMFQSDIQAINRRVDQLAPPYRLLKTAYEREYPYHLRRTI